MECDEGGGGSATSRERRFTVDRFEGDYVVLVEADGRTADFPRWLLPPWVREGDVAVVSAGAGEGEEWRVVLRVDGAATRAARERAGAAIERLRRRDLGGDESR